MSGDSTLSNIQKQAVIRWGWLSGLSESEFAHHVHATFMGWTLDGMDVMVFSFVLPTLIATWHVKPRGQAGLLGTSTLVISSSRRLGCGVAS